MSDSEKKDHSFLKAVGAIAATAGAAYAGVSYYVFRQAFDLDKSRYLPVRRNDAEAPQLSKWISKAERKDEFVNSFDGLSLHALKITNHPESHDWAIIMHDYHACARDMIRYMKACDELGLNMVCPDSRGCGASEGRFTGLGWLEHYDLISWVNNLVEADPDARIILVGKGMGANAVMNAVGDYLPKNVIAAVEVSGYSSLRRELIWAINQAGKVATGATLPCVDFYVKQFLHFSVYDVDTLRQLSLARVPMLLIHGGSDKEVPSEMLDECTAACASEKKSCTILDAGHDDIEEKDEFWNAFNEFVENTFRKA